MDSLYQAIADEARLAAQQLIERAKLKPGTLVAVGCSSSEVLGENIGKGSSPEVGRVIADAILQVLRGHGISLAAQCCEHLNRALIVERSEAERRGYEIVSVVPQPKAGGSFATAVWGALQDPVAVEFVRADAGLDIGDTLIGMHLRHVAVPLRLDIRCIGEANLVAAYSRPKLIGGERAVYA